MGRCAEKVNLNKDLQGVKELAKRISGEEDPSKRPRLPRARTQEPQRADLAQGKLRGERTVRDRLTLSSWTQPGRLLGFYHPRVTVQKTGHHFLHLQTFTKSLSVQGPCHFPRNSKMLTEENTWTKGSLGCFPKASMDLVFKKEENAFHKNSKWFLQHETKFWVLQ